MDGYPRDDRPQLIDNDARQLRGRRPDLREHGRSDAKDGESEDTDSGNAEDEAQVRGTTRRLVGRSASAASMFNVDRRRRCFSSPQSYLELLDELAD